MTAPRFLPWLRRGLARGVGGPDADPAAPLPLRGTVKPTVDLEDSRGVTATAEVTLRLAGPGDVAGLDSAQIVRMVPPDQAADVEPYDFPCVELAAPDLPWRLTPAQATAGRERLRPWLVLVCVEQREGIEYDPTARPLPVLQMSGADADLELPDLAESWAWAHVQSMAPKPQIDAEVTGGSGAVIARLMCPRHLLGGRAYRAALVPAFDVGREAGLGHDAGAFAAAGPAWSHGAMPSVVELPVYVTWTFTTSSEAGDFEALARRLEPDLEGGRMGYHDARVADNGMLAPFTGSTRFEYDGTLVDPSSRAGGLTAAAGEWFRDGMRKALADAAGRVDVPRTAPAGYDPATDDPVLGPPLYGSWAVDRYTVPRTGWLAELNLEPRRRAAAGLGARVVREHQQEYLAAAWDQAGDVRALQEELNRGRLAAEVGRSHARRLSALTDEALLQASSRLHVFVDAGATNAATRLRDSAIMPAAMASAAFARQTRAGTVLARRAGTGVGLRATGQFVAASVSAGDRADAQEPIARFGAAFVGRDTVTAGTTFAVVATDPDPGGFTDVVAVQIPAPIRSTAADQVTGLAADIRAALDPMTSIVAGLDRRLSGLALDRATDLPTRIPVGPRFPDPLFAKLQALGSDRVLPGVDVFGINRVRLLAANEGWIAAFLAGANHEWAREALWNEYPADLGATAFSHFWPRVPPAADLTEDMAGWLPLTTALADHVGGAGASTVLLVRGDLIRRHPETQFMLVTPAADGSLLDAHGDLPADRTLWPAFSGRLDSQTVFVGFDVDPQAVWDAGMYVSIEEPVTGPRFGLDSEEDGDYRTRPAAWADASWANVARSQRALAELTHIRLADTPWLNGAIGGLEWPRNGAHLAGITFQPPFRLLLPATSLMPAP
jgi:hypothetical protein